MILGIDEVGRGAWAGPLVVGAVILDGTLEGLTDSKLLSKARRDHYDALIRQTSKAFALGWVSAREIDEIGLADALKLATIRAVSQIHDPYHEIIIDGTVNFLAGTNKGQYVTMLKKADLLIPSVSAASVLAKVARDDYMARLDHTHPDYGFSRHVGYGTAAHRLAIATHGVTEEHRTSFSPMKTSKSGKSTTAIGLEAELKVAEHLRQTGHVILDRNWKNKFCEIDIVSRLGDTVFFTEVKYRKNDSQGGGIAAITSKKLKKMAFASELYCYSHELVDSRRQLASASVYGSDYMLDAWLPID